MPKTTLLEPHHTTMTTLPRHALSLSCLIATLCSSTVAIAQELPPPPPIDDTTTATTQPDAPQPQQQPAEGQLELPPPLESEALKRPGEVTTPTPNTTAPPKLKLTEPAWRPISQRHASMMYLSSLAGTIVGGGLGIGAVVGLNGLCWTSTNLPCNGLGATTLGTLIGLSAISVPVWAIGHYSDYDGTLVATTSGAAVGSILGFLTIGFSFAAAFNSGNNAPLLGMLAGVAMPPAGALLGYSLSHRLKRPKQITPPTLSIAPTDGGGMIGVGFRF